MPAALTRADLAEELRLRMGLTHDESNRLVYHFLDVMADALARGDKVQLPEVGTWVVVRKKARWGRNPATDEPLLLPARRVVRFRPARLLKYPMPDVGEGEPEAG